jgi:hypothetical protein
MTSKSFGVQFKVSQSFSRTSKDILETLFLLMRSNAAYVMPLSFATEYRDLLRSFSSSFNFTSTIKLSIAEL